VPAAENPGHDSRTWQLTVREREYRATALASRYSTLGHMNHIVFYYQISSKCQIFNTKLMKSIIYHAISFLIKTLSPVWPQWATVTVASGKSGKTVNLLNI